MPLRMLGIGIQRKLPTGLFTTEARRHREKKYLSQRRRIGKERGKYLINPFSSFQISIKNFPQIIDFFLCEPDEKNFFPVLPC